MSSYLQGAEQNSMRPVIEEAVTGLLESTKPHSRVAIADLGCSSGPNALALVSGAVDAIFQHYARHEEVSSVLLNDLPDNDFNNVAKRLVEFQGNDQRVTVGMVPGSFYKRLFSVNWLSRAPEDLRTNGIPMCDGDDDLRKARRPLVLEAYARQFKNDFKLFLNLRAQELVPVGQMVISMLGKCADEDSNIGLNVVAFILDDMVKRGLLDTLYISLHTPSDEELREIIEEEGLFKINKMLVHDHMSGMDKSSITPKTLARAVRAAFEPLVEHLFGTSGQIVEEFVRTTERHMSTASPPQVTVASLFFVCVSLTKMM